MSEFSPSNLNLPKFHHWCHHIIESIKNYGAVNGFVAETYETLHKYYVKNLYRMTNKQNINNQILRKVIIYFNVSICNFLSYPQLSKLRTFFDMQLFPLSLFAPFGAFTFLLASIEYELKSKYPKI